jgi:hypothetical protein
VQHDARVGQRDALPASPAQSSRLPIDAASPMQTVDTGERMYCIVS